MKRLSLLSSSAAMVAALSMAATPVAAAELSIGQVSSSSPAFAVWNSDSETVNNHRYRDRYRGHYRGRHRGGTSVGDVLAGVLIIGGIAAVASAASKSRQERSYPARTNTNYNRNSGASQGIDGAADMCVREIERNVRVARVDRVERSGDGWRVAGSLYNGDGFTCRIGQNGRIDDVTYGSNTSQVRYDGGQDRQWSDDRYRQAWNTAGNSAAQSPAPTSGTPAYPGGPVPGQSYEEYPEYTADQDDRYGG